MNHVDITTYVEADRVTLLYRETWCQTKVACPRHTGGCLTLACSSHYPRNRYFCDCDASRIRSRTIFFVAHHRTAQGLLHSCLSPNVSNEMMQPQTTYWVARLYPVRIYVIQNSVPGCHPSAYHHDMLHGPIVMGRERRWEAILTLQDNSPPRLLDSPQHPRPKLHNTLAHNH